MHIAERLKSYIYRFIRIVNRQLPFISYQALSLSSITQVFFLFCAILGQKLLSLRPDVRFFHSMQSF